MPNLELLKSYNVVNRIYKDKLRFNLKKCKAPAQLSNAK